MLTFRPKSLFSNKNEITSVVYDSDFHLISDRMGNVVKTKDWTLPNMKNN